MSTATTQPAMTAPRVRGARPRDARVPSLLELERLTEIPEQRAVFRGVDWAFYDQLVDSVPARCPIHVDFDGTDLEVMRRGRLHERLRLKLERIVWIAAEECCVPHSGAGETTWKRPQTRCGLEADQSYYFSPEKLDADAAAISRDSDDIADYPNPDLAIEVDISLPSIERAGIYAALFVPEVWRFDGRNVIIERLTADGRYASVESSGFLPVTAEFVRRWLVDEDARDQIAWSRRLRAEIKTQVAKQS